MKATVHVQPELVDGEVVREEYTAHHFIVSYYRKSVDDAPVLKLSLVGQDGKYLYEVGADDITRPRIYMYPAKRTHVVLEP